jgi:hypothetical protein
MAKTQSLVPARAPSATIHPTMIEPGQINAWMNRLGQGERDVFRILPRPLAPNRRLCAHARKQSDAEDAAAPWSEFRHRTTIDSSRPPMGLGIAAWECRTVRQRRVRQRRSFPTP